MRITEIISNIYCYVATIKVKHGKSNTSTRTTIYADGMSQARALLVASYGENSVLAISRITDSQLDEAVPNRTKVLKTPKVLPTAYKHKLAQKALSIQLKRNKLLVKPTIDDLRAANNELAIQQKRMNREYENEIEDRAKWAEIRKRRV
jgi:hypothetical protein